MHYDDWKLASPPEPTEEEQRLRDLITRIGEIALIGINEKDLEHMRWQLEKILGIINKHLR